MTWRDRLRPASFRGAQFHIDGSGQASGRRSVVNEYPKREKPSTEDMGRRARRHPISGYVLGLDYIFDRDDLIAALETPGPGLLIHPTFGEMLVQNETYVVTERREAGGRADFDMLFVECGEDIGLSVAFDTAGLVRNAAASLRHIAATALDEALGRL